ncbi:hypothetical protein [Nonomuraea wenchangensis]|uniref:Type III restriction enzyme n=1 Tax=Nonomuraea wenchangensis TaxID=568860 RepID=A0A1I0LWQ9_9ACTN|nr:hypothetical protein [Nonomuraea wenchangensis]SEU47585.1 type III restriction enzyme [Nonomuraea wenchangensis]
MSDRVIENPIINSLYLAPTRRFKFDNDDIREEIEEGRSPSSYFIPVPRAQKRGAQVELDTPELGLTDDQIELNHFVNRIRDQVAHWRTRGFPNVSATSRRLLEYWSDPECGNLSRPGEGQE